MQHAHSCSNPCSRLRANCIKAVNGFRWIPLLSVTTWNMLYHRSALRTLMPSFSVNSKPYCNHPAWSLPVQLNTWAEESPPQSPVVPERSQAARRCHDFSFLVGFRKEKKSLVKSLLFCPYRMGRFLNTACEWLTKLSLCYQLLCTATFAPQQTCDIRDFTLCACFYTKYDTLFAGIKHHTKVAKGHKIRNRNWNANRNL